jgi:hypothetical protein
MHNAESGDGKPAYMKTSNLDNPPSLSGRDGRQYSRKRESTRQSQKGNRKTYNGSHEKGDPPVHPAQFHTAAYERKNGSFSLFHQACASMTETS